MSKEYYKKKLIDLRAQIAKEREAKKKTMPITQKVLKWPP